MVVSVTPSGRAPAAFNTITCSSCTHTHAAYTWNLQTCSIDKELYALLEVMHYLVPVFLLNHSNQPPYSCVAHSMTSDLESKPVVWCRRTHMNSIYYEFLHFVMFGAFRKLFFLYDLWTETIPPIMCNWIQN